MRNPVPDHYRKPLGNVVLLGLLYLAGKGLLGMVGGSVDPPSLGMIVGYLIGGAAGVWMFGSQARHHTTA